MRSTRAVLCGLAALAALAVVGCGGGARLAAPVHAPATARVQNDTLSASEWDELRAGGRVEHPMAFERNRAQYIGGVSYQVVDADPDTVLHAMLEPDRLCAMLPKTTRVEPVGQGHPARTLELDQGNDLVKATYSVVLEHDYAKREVRFWLDRSRRSDIEDVWGFFRVVPFEDGQSLITVGAALDVGSGLVRMLFENTIQRLILATPTQMKDVIEASTPPPSPSRMARNP